MSSFYVHPLVHPKLKKSIGCVVALTGKVDYVSDGNSVIALHNGHEMLGRITGSGCMVGSCIASFCAGQASLPHDDEIITRGFVNQYMIYAAVGG